MKELYLTEEEKGISGEQLEKMLGKLDFGGSRER